MFRQMSVAALVALAALGNFTFASAQEPKAARGADKKPEDDDWKDLREAIERKYDWDLLRFGEDSKSGHITKLRIVLYKTDGVPWARYVKRDKEFVYETEDPKVLRLAEFFLTNPLRRVANDGGVFLGPGKCDGLGKVELKCTKQSFYLGIANHGFSMDSDILVPQNEVYSWGLAKLIDDALMHDTKEHLPEVMMKSLSGEASIEGQKYQYRNAYPSTKNANSGQPQSPPSANQPGG